MDVPMSDNRMQQPVIVAGRYQVLDCVGIGGMAEVYRAYDMVLSRIVALKVMLPKYASSAMFFDRFRAEAQSAAALTSPHSVHIYDWGFEGNRCFIIMEYIEGIDLKAAMRNGGLFRPVAAARIGSQVCGALHEAHGRNVIHSDVKPSNIMMLRTGDAKITDFGIAQARNMGASDPQAVLGTVKYMSPEQLRGEPLTPASDLYALGITLFEICTGALPFEGTGASKALEARVHSAPASLKALNPQIDNDFEQLILTCLNPVPSKRFVSARRMQLALDDYVASHAAADAACASYPYEPAYWALAFLVDGKPSGNIIRIESAQVIGRSDTADICLPSRAVSKIHARVAPEGLFLRVEDLGAANGVYLNGSLIHERALCFPGDVITIGETNFAIACKHIER